MTAKEAREIRNNNTFELMDWQMNNTEALNAVDSAIEHLMRIRRTLQRDSDILNGDKTKTNDDDHTALHNAREAAMMANSLKSLSHAAWNLSDNLSLA